MFEKNKNFGKLKVSLITFLPHLVSFKHKLYLLFNQIGYETSQNKRAVITSTQKPYTHTYIRQQRKKSGMVTTTCN